MARPYVSVTEAAERLGVHPQRVHQRIQDGSLQAEKIGNQWAVDLGSLQRVAKHSGSRGRPLSAKSAWELLVFATDDARVAAMNPVARSRARTRLRDLLSHGPTAGLDQAAAMLAHLLRNRAERRLFVASPRDVPDIHADPRVHISGISLPESNMSGGQVVEGYIAGADAQDLVEDYLLSPSHEPANVIMHVVPAGAQAPPLATPLNLADLVRSKLVLAADLAEHDGVREKAEAVRLLDDLHIACRLAEIDAEDERRARAGAGTETDSGTGPKR